MYYVMAAPLPLCLCGEVIVEVDSVLVGGARHAPRARALALGSYLVVSDTVGSEY